MNKKELQIEYNKVVEDFKNLQTAYDDILTNLHDFKNEHVIIVRNMTQQNKQLEKMLNKYQEAHEVIHEDISTLRSVIDTAHRTLENQGKIRRFFQGSRNTVLILGMVDRFISKQFYLDEIK